VSFNYLLTPHFMNVPRVNIVNVPHVTKPLATCSIYIVEMLNLHNCNLVEVVIIFLVDVMFS
jgi:hypothetical protein